MREARQGLLNQTGTLWNVDQVEVPAIVTQYCRQQVVQPHAISPAMSQELMTLAHAVDYLLMGKIAGAAAILCQRITSLEAVAKGSHWSTGRQLELVRHDQYSIAEGSEALGAARRAREEERLKNLLSKAPSGKGGAQVYDGKGRKGKSASKGKPDEGGKGRGAEQRGRDDAKNAGRK